jgi:hypothetical protein
MFERKECEPCLSMRRVYTPCPRMRGVCHVQIFESTRHVREGMSLLGHVCEGWGERVEEGGDHVHPETVLDCAGKPERRQVYYRSFLEVVRLLFLLFAEDICRLFTTDCIKLRIIGFNSILHCKDSIPKIRKKIFPEMKLRGLSPNSTIHVSVNDLYIPTIGLPIALQENRWPDRENM